MHEYRDFGVDLHVMNERRFGLSFPAPFSRTVPVDVRKVNSILRPTLPATEVWSIRDP